MTFNHTEYQRQYSANRREAIQALKAFPCVDCGGTFAPCVMDFDHRDPTTKVKRLSQMCFASWAIVLAEIAKCDLVCACCHRLRTYKGDTSQHTRRYKHHRTIVDELKSSQPCADCGRRFQSAQVDFDHLGEKTSCVGHLLGSTTEKLVAEIAKCHLVCANCHRVRTTTGVRPTLPAHPLVEQFKEIASRHSYPQDLRLLRGAEWRHLIGTMKDADVAKLAGVTPGGVTTARQKLGIPSFRHRPEGLRKKAA
jgi:hypothetical protein